jgi:hypothetical protein
MASHIRLLPTHQREPSSKLSSHMERRHRVSTPEATCRQQIHWTSLKVSKPMASRTKNAGRNVLLYLTPLSSSGLRIWLCLSILAKSIALDEGRAFMFQDGARGTPFHIACKQSHAKVVHVLLSYGADPGESSCAYVDALFAALNDGYDDPEIVRLCLKWPN